MSSQSTASSGSNALHIITDTSKVFLGGNETNSESYTNNSTYNPITIYEGTIMGRITGTDIVVPWRSDNVDGSQYPIGLLVGDMQIVSGATNKATICNGGRVAAEQIIAAQLSNQSVATTLQLTVSSVGGRRVKDLLEQLGLHLVYSTQMTRPDNA
jgi:hypothetical protein